MYKRQFQKCPQLDLLLLGRLIWKEVVLRVSRAQAVYSRLVLIGRHPSVLRDYDNMLCIEDLEQNLVWLRRPIREWPSLPH